MKKNTLIIRGLITTVAAASLLSINAVAAQSNALPAVPVTAASQENKEEAQQTKYKLVEGKIASVSKEDGYVRISLENDDMGLVCNVNETAFVIDQKDGSVKSIADLKEGMEVSAVLDQNSPMTLSLPPMTSGVVGFVLKSDTVMFTDLSVYNDELVNQENTLKLNIGEDTKIVDITGAKKIFTEEDIKGSECLVIYGATTRSIPAQTTPAFVMILNNEEMSQPETEMPEEEKKDEENKNETVGLREAAEKLGYTIKWEANDKPVSMERDNVKIEVTVGSKICSINGIYTQLEQAPTLEDGKIFVSGEVRGILDKYTK